MNVGILYPGSNAHPAIGSDFLQGIKNFLKAGDLAGKINILSEGVGTAGSPKEVYQKAEKLLIADDVDILVAFIDLKVVTEIEPLVCGQGKLLIVVNPGANYPDTWQPQPNIIHLTLQHAFLCWLAGGLAGQSSNHGAVMASTFYDCGYLHTAAMVNNFTRHNGELRFNYINKDNSSDTFNIDPLTDFLSFEKETNNLLCVFDAQPALLFYDHLNRYEDGERLHLYVSPMMLEQGVLEKANGFKFSIEGYLPWCAGKSPDNTNFNEVYLKQNKIPSQFSLLGWEVGIILKNIFYGLEEYSDGTKIAGLLKQKKLESPRGELSLDDKTNYFIAGVIRCSMKENTNTMAMEFIENVFDEWKEFAVDSAGTISSGWTNTYLCY